METKTAKGVNDQGFKLSDRWKESERDGIKTGTLGFGDISSWARGVTKPLELACDQPVNRHSQPITSLQKVAAYYSRQIPKPKQEVVIANCIGKFDEYEHAVKVAAKIQWIQYNLGRVLASAKIRTKRQKVVKVKETVKEATVALKDIKPIEGFVQRVPEFLSREPRTEIKPGVERGKVDPVTWARPSQGGRAGRIERWGE